MKELKEKFKNNDGVISPKGILISVLLHISIFLFTALSMNFWYQPPKPNTVFIDFNQFETASEKNENEFEEINNEEEENINEPENIKEPEEIEEPVPEEKNMVYYSLNPEEADTSSLDQIYREPTRNVRIKYPAGWTFMDQNVKGKLDAVTFWSTSKKYDSPPYVFLEVKEKYLFNPARFTDTLITDYYTAYYNQPEELAGQVSQIFYFRTDDDKDFSIKLIVKGKENFEIFQKEFFGMIKTFRFGSRLF